MKIDITSFQGEMPRVDPTLLPMEAATEAINCFFDAGVLEGSHFNQPVTTPYVAGVATRSIYFDKRGQYLSWNRPREIIESPIAQDPYERIYFTGLDTTPMVRGRANNIAGIDKIGVKSPASPPGLIMNDGGSDMDSSTVENRAYVYTFVSRYGEESGPSPAGGPIELDDPTVDTVTVRVPTEAFVGYSLSKKRIYRTVTGDETSFYFVAEVPYSTTEYTDSLQAEELGPELTTYDYDPPPDNMRGLTLGANGIAAGFAGNEVMFSEPYLPYAYPFKYRLSTEHDVVAIGATSTGFVVATKGYPYLFTGVHPEGISQRKLDVLQACTSMESLVDMGEYIVYASPDGLIAVSEQGAKLITRKILTEREWADFHPGTIKAYRHEHRYVGFYDGGADSRGGFVFDMERGDITRLPYVATAGYNDLLTDNLYLVIGASLYSWGGNPDSRHRYTWKSKIFQTPEISFSVVKVWTNTPGDVGVSVYCDGTEIFAATSLGRETIKIPSHRGTRWQLKLTGRGTVERLTLAQSMGEI